MKKLIEKYGKSLIDMVIKIDDLTPEEIKDYEYLEDRIITHLEWSTIDMKLTNREINVLLVALDHMEEHITDLMEERTLKGDIWKERLDAYGSIRNKIKNE